LIGPGYGINFLALPDFCPRLNSQEKNHMPTTFNLILLVFISTLSCSAGAQTPKTAPAQPVAIAKTQTNLTGVIKAAVALSPVGDFTATIRQNGAFATKTADGKVIAKNLKFEVKNLDTGLELRTTHAKDKYLEMKKYPTIDLIEAVGQNGKGTAKIRLHGKENTVTGTYTIIQDKILSAKFNVKLSDFDINDINYKGVGVDDEVPVEIQLPLQK
jgi:polyisoprenoid-binding protein YceI